MSKFSITIDDTAVNRKIAAMNTQYADLSRPMKDSGEKLRLIAIKCFEQQKGPDGQPWAKNELSTLRAYLKERGGYTPKGKVSANGRKLLAKKNILTGITGLLKLSISAEAFRDSFVLFSPREFSGSHQFGALTGRGLRTIIPARPFMPVIDGELTPAARKIVITALARHLTLA